MHTVPIDREGTFRGPITTYFLHEKNSAESKSVGVILSVDIHEAWVPDESGGQWQDWRQYQFYVGGYINLIRADGRTYSEANIESLAKNAGWDGTIESITEEAWKPIPVQVKVRQNSSGRGDAFSIDLVNGFSDDPNRRGTVDGRALQAQHGAALRAIVGNVKRNSGPQSGQPQTPPSAPAPQAPQPPQQGQQHSAPADQVAPPDPAPDDEIPF